MTDCKQNYDGFVMVPQEGTLYLCFTYCYMPSQLYDLAVNIFFRYAAFLGRRADEEVVPRLRGTV